MSEVFKWADPPVKPPSRLSRTISRLKERPGDWAMVARCGQGIEFMPWWGPLNTSPDFEVKIVSDNPHERPFAFGPRSIYAKYVGHDT